jgi:hypothetical protein
MASSAIHRERRSEQRIKSGRRPMDASVHIPDDLSESLKLSLLGGQKRRHLEKRDHAFEQVSSPSYDEHQGLVTQSVSLDVSAPTEADLNQSQNLSTIAVLAHVKLWYELKSTPARGIAIYNDGEGTLPIDVTGNVAIQPFLLIVRTRHIVTVPSVSDGTSSAGYSEFPAYSQIYRQQWSTVSRRSEPSSRTALMGEQPNPWDLLQPQDATSRHRGAKPGRRCGLLGPISLLSPEYLLSVERRRFHLLPPDH